MFLSNVAINYTNVLLSLKLFNIVFMNLICSELRYGNMFRVVYIFSFFLICESGLFLGRDDALSPNRKWGIRLATSARINGSVEKCVPSLKE